MNREAFAAIETLPTGYSVKWVDSNSSYFKYVVGIEVKTSDSIFFIKNTNNKKMSIRLNNHCYSCYPQDLLKTLLYLENHNETF